MKIWKILPLLLTNLILFSLVSAQDLNRDGKVDVLDLNIVWEAYQSKPGDPNWNPDCDLNDDGVINMLDVSKVARKFGENVSEEETIPSKKVENYTDQIIFRVSEEADSLYFSSLAVWSDEYGLNFCRDESCLEADVFFKNEPIYLDFISEIPGVSVDAVLTYPDRTTRQVSLPTLLRAEKAGKYTVKLTASKSGYGSAERTVQFSVVERAECGNGVCEIRLRENFGNCPQDCPSGRLDKYCDGLADGICDPDCRPEEDPDCQVKTRYLSYSLFLFILVTLMIFVFYSKWRLKK